MRILLIGAGGVGSAFCGIASRRSFFEAVVVCDYDEARAAWAAEEVGDERFSAARVDASSVQSVAELIRQHQITHVMNAVDPRFVMPIFDGALAGGADYLDMAMSLSKPHPDEPYRLPGVKLGDEQFATEGRWRAAGRLAWVGLGREPELFDFPGGIGPVECVNVEHEEVLLMPRWVTAKRVTFKYGLGEEFIDVLKTLHKLGLDRTEKVNVGGAEVSPRDVVAACLPNPATLGPKMHG